jgi:hypothetical protein
MSEENGKPPDMEVLQRDFRETFGSERGERVLAHMCSAFYLGDTTFEPGSDPLKLAFNEGQRFVVLRILALCGRINMPDMEDLWRKKL